MSAAAKPSKVKRQGQSMPKRDSHFRLSIPSNEWVEQMAEKYRVSKAKVLDAMLRRKPEPDEFYLR